MRLSFEKRRRLLMARTGALVMDTVLVAYVLWGLSHLQARTSGDPGFLSRWPGLVCTAPFLALFWQSLTDTLGQLAYRLRFVEGAGSDAPAHASRRGLYLVASGLQVAVLLGALFVARDPQIVLLLMLAAALSMGLSSLVDPLGRSIPERLAGLRATTRPAQLLPEPAPWWRRSRVWIVLFILALTFWIGIGLTRMDFGRMSEGWPGFRRIWDEITEPDWSTTGVVIDKIVETVFMALLASTLAIPVAFGFSILGARNLMHGTLAGKAVYTLVRLVLNVTRSIEPIIWVITLSIWVGVGPFAGMLALFVHSVAALGKLYSEAIENIDPGPVEAIRTTGANWPQTVRYAVVPQVVTPFLAFTVYRWDINVRMATILGFVGGGGIGEKLTDTVQVSAWSKAGTIMFFITLVVWAMDIGSSKARERLQ